MTGRQFGIVCRDTAAGRLCDWEVRDSDEWTLLESARYHLQRRHALEVLPEQLRSLLRPIVPDGVGGI